MESLPAGPIRRSLTLSIFDGLLWSIMFGVSENWIVPFALLFGANYFQVGLLQGAAQLVTGLGQLTGSQITGRGVSRRLLSRTMVIIHASGWLVIYWGTVWTGSVWFAIASYCGFLFLANFGGPGWLSWMNDLVPSDKRGAYWSFRNSLSGLMQLVPIAVTGLALERAQAGGTEMGAYGWLFAVGFLARLGGAVCLHFQHEPPLHQPTGAPMKLRAFVGELRSSNFGRFVLFSIFLNFTVQMIYPIIQVYLLKELGMDYSQYTWVTMTFTIASFVFMLYWGPLSDRFGNRRILLVSALILPLAALAWIFVKDWRLMIVLQLVSGFAISGINLTTGNFIFDAVKPERVAKTFAYFNALNTAFGFLGSVSGGALADLIKTSGWHWGVLGPLTTVFLLTGLLRVGVIAAFAKGFSEVRNTEPSPGLRYFYIYKPWQDASGWITDSVVKVARKVRLRRKRR